MNPAALDGTPYRVPPEPSRWRALTLAVVVHAGLLFFLWAGVSWQSTPPVAVEAEVWDMKVQSAAPPPEPAPEPKVEPEPPPPPPKPVERPPEVEPTPKPPDIALEQARLRAKELKERKEKEAEEKKLAEAKAKKLEEEEKKKQELAEKKKQEKADKLAKAKAEAAEKKKLADLRAAEMQRITGAIGTSGTAARSTAPRIDSGYTASITAKVKSNTTFLGSTDVPGNPRAVFKVEQLPTGEIISARKIKSSGVASFDDAVEKGIIKSSPLPKKKDGTVERTLEIGFSMKDLD
ncbi:cell envelope integrity protein TolA [Massilia sp. MAHUQ-52]|uniref:Cell envelope integrity protein TolA n=2 Tax=Telluria group TaxID=2895353 RepID=A0ABS8IWA2_9BURK|nr:cell envelope integrity protein TolA [Massilia agrisoli]